MDKTAYDRCTFGVSIFHAYGHDFPCQILYSPRRILGAGLTDGEANERVWAKLRYLLLDMSINFKGIS
jgi:hypothetical protein